MKEWWFENHCLLTFLWNWRGPLWRVDELLYLLVLSKLLLPSRGTVVRTESTFLHRIWYNSDNLSPKCACALLIEAVAGALRVSTISLDFRFDHHSLRDKKKKDFHDYVFKLRAKIKVVALHRALFPFMIEKYIVLHFWGEDRIVLVTIFEGKLM